MNLQQPLSGELEDGLCRFSCPREDAGHLEDQEPVEQNLNKNHKKFFNCSVRRKDKFKMFIISISMVA
jgi:hypothetical protein